MKTAHGYDRITLWTDGPDLAFAPKKLSHHCQHIEVTYGQMHFQPTAQIKVDLFQPSTKCLELIASELCRGTAVLITYVEIALDLLADNDQDSNRWKIELLKSVRMRYQRNVVLQSEDGDKDGAHYFGRRRDRNTLAVYADNPSKLNVANAKGNDSPCLHIEWRASGSDALFALGIVSIEDLIKFDHEAFWNEGLCFYRMPRRTELGRILTRAATQREDVGDAALRKRARNWEALNSDVRGNFILHNALLGKAHIVRQLLPMTISEWKKSLNAKPAGASNKARRRTKRY